MKICSKCKVEKSLDYFVKDKNRKYGVGSNCKDCQHQTLKEYYQKNKININNKRKLRLKNNHLHRLKSNIRNLIRNSVISTGYSKKTKTFVYLDCSFEEFRIHLEKQFKYGMNWENYGKWHLDHIYPVSLAESEEEIIKLNHYTNFQPLWALDNILKRNKY
jgi:hypothetical protein